jgi:hypothetical protein
VKDVTTIRLPKGVSIADAWCMRRIVAIRNVSNSRRRKDCLLGRQQRHIRVYTRALEATRKGDIVWSLCKSKEQSSVKIGRHASGVP